MKFCVDCDYHYEVFWTCLYPITHLARDPISGNDNTCALKLEEARHRECYCGAHGKWFKPKEAK